MEKTATCYNPHIELMPKERIKSLQLDLLRKQLYYVFNCSKLFNDKCTNANITPYDVRKLDDLRKIPVTTREDIENYIDKTGDPYGGIDCISTEHRRENILLISILKGMPPTKPIYGVMSRTDFSSLTEQYARQWVMLGIGKGDIVIVQHDALSGDHLGLVSTSYLSWRPDVYRLLHCIILVCPVFPVMDAPRMVQYSKLFNISSVFTQLPFLSFMEDICKREGSPPKDFKYKSIVARGREEIVSEEVKNKLREIWGAKVQTMLYTPENMFYAQDCPEETGLHIWEDMFIVEALNEENEPVEAGKVGKLTITNLFAEGSPLIRYKTDANVILNEDICRCGRTHLRIMSPQQG
jgi:phenylacetate-CoA ligase